MNKKPILLLYCQHSLGMGHLRRSIEISKVLLNKFQVVFINGGRIPAAIPRPEGIEFIDLPALGMNANGKLISYSKELNLNAAKEVRRKVILEQFESLKPDVLLVELFPFGRKKFAFELLPLLRLAGRSRPKPLVVCDLRDILVDERGDQQHFDDRARWISNRYFDAVLMHTDPKFARLEESFRPRKPLTIPVFYTGFVTGNMEHDEAFDQNPGIVVSAGGGNVGSGLFKVAIKTQTIIWQKHQIPMSIVAGPFLPESDWLWLEQQAQNVPGLSLYRSVPDLKCLLQQARISVSQCGYNTTMDLLKTQIPALLVPYAEAGENEQSKRALKLKKLGLVRVIPEAELTTQTLVQEIDALLAFKPKAIELQMNGASQSTTILFDLLTKLSEHPAELNDTSRHVYCESYSESIANINRALENRNTGYSKHRWLDELIFALDQRVKPVQFFFRNDDAGWAESQLFKLLDCFLNAHISIDLAVIPQAIDQQNLNLYNRIIDANGLIGVHQHGYKHCNYQLQGRKCEFGSDRTLYQQQADIKAGQAILLDYFAGQFDPIFTPPWNRCNQDTVEALTKLGFTTLSRDNTATPLLCQNLQELAINCDWFKQCKGIRLNWNELAQLMVQIINRGEVVGIMLHHEIMEQQEIDRLNELLELLRSHPKIKCERMKDIFNAVTVETL